MNINGYTISTGDNNTILIKDSNGITYRVDINNYNVNEHTYIYENTRQTTNDYTTIPGYVYSQNITQGNSIGVTFPTSLIQSDSSSGRTHTTENFRNTVADSTKQFMNDLPDLISKINNKDVNTTTSISSSSEPNYTVITRGWSGGTQPAVELAAANGSSVAVMIDPNKSGLNSSGLEQPSSEIYQTLKDNGTVIVSIKGNEQTSNIATNTERGAIDNGIPVYVVKNNAESNHTELENFARETRVDAFLSGEISYEQYVANCKAKGYDPNNISLLKVTGYNANGESITEKISFNDYAALKGTAPTANSYVEDSNNNFSELSDFAKQYQGNGDTLGSNLSYVSNSMNDLISKISAHTDLNYTKESDNEANILSALYKASDYYGSVTNVLYGNLSAEADAVYGIANAIFKMDGCAAAIAEESLTDSVKALYDPSNPAIASQLESLNKATSELYDTARNAVNASGRYEEISSLLGTTTEAGSVGKLSLSSLESAINAIVPNLEEEVNKANGLKSSVDDFMSGIGSSNILQGGVWDNVKTNMESYQNLLDCNAKAATFLSDTIKTAMGLVANYIQGASASINAIAGTEYSGFASVGELDDSKLPEIRSTIGVVKENIETARSTIASMKAATVQQCTTYEDEDGNPKQSCTDVPKYTAAEIAPFEAKLAEYEEVLGKLEEYAGVLEGLAPVVEKAQKIIDDAIGQVKNTYENPVIDTEGNQSFNTDFNLDLSAYGIDPDVDYKQLVDDYYNKTKSLVEPQSDNGTGSTEPTTTGSTEPATTGSTEPEDDYKPDYTPGTKTGSGSGNKTEPELESTSESMEVIIEESGNEEEQPVEEVLTETETIEEQEPELEIDTEPAEIIYIEDEPEEEQVIEAQEDRPRQKITGGPSNNQQAETSIIEELPTEVIEDIVDTAEENEYLEQEIKAPTIENAVTNNNKVDNSETEKKLTTMGIASVAGTVLGAVSLGTYSILKNKDKEEEEEIVYEK